MANSPGEGRLPIFRKAERLLASELNQIVNALVRRITGGGGVEVRTFGDQIIISQQTPTPIAVTLTQMVVKSDEGDYLICRTLDAAGTEGDQDVYVLKPWILRRSPFEGLTVNGVSYTYSANGTRLADGTETQKITQDYYDGAVILVRNQNVSVEVVSDTFVSLVDSNDSGRRWCEPE